MITINHGDNNSVVGVTSVSSNSTSSSTTCSTTSTSSAQTIKSDSIRINTSTLSALARDIEDRYLFDSEQAKIREYEMYRRIERGRRRAHRKKQQQHNTKVVSSASKCTTHAAFGVGNENSVVNDTKSYLHPQPILHPITGCINQNQQHQYFQPVLQGLNYVQHPFPPILDPRFVLPLRTAGPMHIPVNTLLHGYQVQHAPFPQPLFVSTPVLQPLNNNTFGGNPYLVNQQQGSPSFNKDESSLSDDTTEGVFQLDM
jgi:hypothetical protein